MFTKLDPHILFHSTCKHTQVWFQNARAKLRRSLTTSDSPSAPVRGVTVATGQPQLFPTSTIDQLQLSLLTSPLGDPPTNPVSFLDDTSQGAAGREDFGNAAGGGRAEGEVGPQYC